MIINHISSAKLAKKNDICKFKCKNAYFFFMETVSRKSGISYKQTARPLRVALFLYCILFKDYFTSSKSTSSAVGLALLSAPGCGP